MTTDTTTLNSMRDYWGAYHHHKEQMAFAVAALYLGGATTVLFHADSAWPAKVPAVLISATLALSAILSFVFVDWQLTKRETAAGIVEACSCLIASKEVTAADDASATRWRGVPLPSDLVRKLTDLEAAPNFLSEPSKSRAVTLGAMAIWTLAAVAALAIGHA